MTSSKKFWPSKRTMFLGETLLLLSLLLVVSQERPGYLLSTISAACFHGTNAGSNQLNLYYLLARYCLLNECLQIDILHQYIYFMMCTYKIQTNAIESNDDLEQLGMLLSTASANPLAIRTCCSNRKDSHPNAYGRTVPPNDQAWSAKPLSLRNLETLRNDACTPTVEKDESSPSNSLNSQVWSDTNQINAPRGYPKLLPGGALSQREWITKTK